MGADRPCPLTWHSWRHEGIQHHSLLTPPNTRSFHRQSRTIREKRQTTHRKTLPYTSKNPGDICVCDNRNYGLPPNQKHGSTHRYKCAGIDLQGTQTILLQSLTSIAMGLRHQEQIYSRLVGNSIHACRLGSTPLPPQCIAFSDAQRHPSPISCPVRLTRAEALRQAPSGSVGARRIRACILGSIAA